MPSGTTRESPIRVIQNQPHHCGSSTGQAHGATDIEPSMSILWLSPPLMLQLGVSLLPARIISALPTIDLSPMIGPDRLNPMLGSIGVSQGVVPGQPRPLDRPSESLIGAASLAATAAAFRRLRWVHGLGSHPGLSPAARTLAASQKVTT